MRRKPEDIVDLVKGKEAIKSALDKRFETDYTELYLLDTFAGDPDGGTEDGQEEDLSGYRVFTSNESRTYADKMNAFGSTANLIIQVPSVGMQEEQREVNNDKERFLIGAFKAADERLLKRGRLPVLVELSFYVNVRGWITGLCLLSKRRNGSTVVDITPWDPLHVTWGMDEDGLAWICHKLAKTAEEIKADHGIDIPNETNQPPDHLFDVYDFYDREHNQVVAENTDLKKAIPHGSSPNVPAYLDVAATAPFIQQANAEGEDSLKNYGESIWGATRDIYPKNSSMLSVLYELVARARKQPLLVGSDDGSKTLDEDPHRAGSVISISKDRESVEVLDLLKVPPELGPFMAMVSGEIQRGTLPHSIYGDIQFALSGFAIKTLRQGTDSQLRPRVLAVQHAYQQMSNLLADQYATGRFEPFEVSGRGQNRQYFSLTVTPERVKQGGEVEVRLVPDIPEDDAANFAQAQIAREGPVPLFPDRHIRERILKVQDAEVIGDEVNSQLAERGLPEAGLWTLMKSLEDRGNTELAQFYFAELMQLLIQKMGGQIPALPSSVGPDQLGPGGGGGNGAGPSGPPRFDPSIAPNATIGAPPPGPNAQQGPLVPPGTPRPGALDRLRAALPFGLGG